MTLVLKKFSADWCAPCRKMEPIIDSFEKMNFIKVEKIDIEDQPDVAQKFNIRSIPALIWVKKQPDGEEIVVDLHVGMCSLEKLVETTNDNLSRNPK